MNPHKKITNAMMRKLSIITKGTMMGVKSITMLLGLAVWLTACADSQKNRRKFEQALPNGI